MKARLFFVVFFIFFPVLIFSQSKFLEDGVGGSNFSIISDFDDSGYISSGIYAGYSIGGIMDFGVMLNLGLPKQEMDFAFIYDIIVLKQNDYNPVNFQLEGAYGFTHSLTDQTKDLRGFNLGAFLFHEFFRKSVVSVLLGAKAKYSNYLNVTYDTSDPNNPAILSSMRVEKFFYGGEIAISLKIFNWPVISAGLTGFYIPEAAGIEFEPFLSLTTGS